MSTPEDQGCSAASGDLRLNTTLCGVRDEHKLGSENEYRAVLAEWFDVSFWHPSRSSPRVAEPVASHRCSSRPSAGAEWRAP